MDKRNSSSESGEDIEVLSRRCIAIMEFLAALGRLGPRTPLFMSAIQNAYDQRNLRALRAAADDLAGRVRRLNDEEQRALREALDDRLGTAVQEDVRVPLAAVHEILSHEAIDNDEEYALLGEFVDEHYADPAHESTVRRANGLLAQYAAAK